MFSKFDPKTPYHYTRRNEWEINSIIGSLVSGNGKPHGLWYCFGDEWLRWVVYKEEEFLDYWYPYAYKLTINYEKVLRISTSKKKIKKLFDQYAFEKHPEFPVIDWDKVRKEYAGIEFYPYYPWDVQFTIEGGFSPLRFNMWNLVNNLDMASGCVWDPEGILHAEGPIAVPKISLI